jgi:peptidoglycan/LPS O-acetylase OafA/YrhL
VAAAASAAAPAAAAAAAESAPAPTPAPAPAPAPAPTPAPAPAHTAKPGRIRRLPGLDGLRGIAVAAVLIYHFFGSALPGGFLGVDVFFVLSGFLITALLVREYGHNGRISLKGFWQRRARRILPAAATVLVICTAVAGLIGGDAAVNLPPQFLGSLFFVNNWVQISEAHSYFADTTPQIFMHYWSLAIEEQFYVLWPLLFLGMILLARRMGVHSAVKQMRWPAVLAGVIGVASLIAMIVLFTPDEDPSRVYFGTDTHAFGLVTGVVLALIVTTPSDWQPDSFPALVRPGVTKLLSWTLAPVALVALVAMIVLLPDTSPVTYRGGLFAASLLSAVVILSVVRAAGPVPFLLRWRPLRYLGERSFSLYLWHWPVVVFLLQVLQDGPKGQETGVPDWGVGLISVAVSLVLSELSYRYVETPFRRRGYRGVLDGLGGAKRMLPVPVVALAATLLAGVALGDSPKESALEAQLNSISQMQQSPPPAAPGSGTGPGTADASLPAGKDITAIGDSVMLASAPSLYRTFPGITVDAETSRHYTAGAGVIDAMLANDTLGDYVVLGFGTNGQAFDGQLDQIMDQIGPDHKVVIVVPYGHQDPIPTAAQQVIDYASSRKDVYLAPWCSAAADHPEALFDDGVHPNDQGGPLYADAVADGLRHAKAGNQDTGISCPL